MRADVNVVSLRTGQRRHRLEYEHRAEAQAGAEGESAGMEIVQAFNSTNETPESRR
jgi:hypothetical protein